VKRVDLPVFGFADQCDVESAGSDGRAHVAAAASMTDPLGLAFAHTQAVAAEFELQRITERRDAEQPNLHAGSQSHFQQPDADVVVAVDRHDAGLATDAEFRQSHHTVPSGANEHAPKTSSERKAKFVERDGEESDRPAFARSLSVQTARSSSREAFGLPSRCAKSRRCRVADDVCLPHAAGVALAQQAITRSTRSPGERSAAAGCLKRRADARFG